MKVLIFEPLWTGHRFAYLSHLIPAINRLGISPILVTSRQAIDSKSFHEQLGQLNLNFEIQPIVKVSDQFRTWNLAQSFESSLKQFQPDHCFLPAGDGISQIIAARSMTGRGSHARDIDTEVLHFQGRFGYNDLPNKSWVGNWKRRMGRLILPKTPWRTFFHLDSFQLKYLCQGNDEFAQRCVIMPDPVEPPLDATKFEARRALGLPQDSRIVGCAGSINHRKGIDLLIKAFCKIQPQLRPSDRVLLAGPISQPMRNQIKTEFQSLIESNRLICLDDYLSVRDFSLALAAMDIVATPYPFHCGSSSIIIRAALIGRPVIATDVAWIGRTVRDFSLGHVCNVQNETDFGSQLLLAMDEFETFELNAKAKQFLRFHTIENFCATWLKRLSQKADQPTPSQPIPWAWG